MSDSIYVKQFITRFDAFVQITRKTRYDKKEDILPFKWKTVDCTSASERMASVCWYNDRDIKKEERKCQRWTPIIKENKNYRISNDKKRYLE